MKIFTFYMSGKTVKVRQPDRRVAPANPLELYRQFTLRRHEDGKRGYLTLHGSHDQFSLTPGVQKFLARWAEQNKHLIGQNGRVLNPSRQMPAKPRTDAERLALIAAQRTGRPVHVMHAMAGVA